MKTKIMLALLVTNLLWLAAYVHSDAKRNDYHNQIIKAEDAIRSLPDTKTYFLGQEQSGDLIVYCLKKDVDPTIQSRIGDRMLDISCGKPADETVAKEQ